MIELIPAIDIIDGKCVRLSQGDYDSKKVYNENPVEVALELEAHGIRRLHVVDLSSPFNVAELASVMRTWTKSPIR